ncbi:D-serine/D-alanine/glycine transporter [Cryobacterium sp. PH29-G1]|uniref:D-serine/D-alanine/glycine transporter n=1 Tax=Cryobacterium sp. PH29-G1 TaxID=3046211 RepID=UPI0024B92B09|nr:D-serine/D-alanine/glycine transporter [Cryobacterium sp. PH29-G1]MDJ0349620.1 D-serine/D-alanine/glycine transporter [Cryobacterium sp. PH29-G1]
MSMKTPSVATSPRTSSGQQPHLARSLSNRHIQLIAIGGAIGTGLFMGSGKTIALAGPSVIFVYMIIGFMLFFVMRAMGELLLSNLEYKTFSDFAGDLLGPWAGFFTSWTYWLCWIVTGIAELIAIALYTSFWWPDLPLWIPALAAVGLLLGLNLTSVRAFGETEFWFALIKIVAIVTLIVVGLVMVITHFKSPGGAPASFSNLWNDGGMFPTGPMGFIAGFQIAVFAFVGLELIGTTAAEAKDPEKNLPKAINSIPIRIMLFYVVALIMIMTVTPWREVTAEASPFVAMFSLAGIGIAAGVINFVVLTSATSSANSGLYSTSRMMFGLAGEGTAPGRFQRLSRHRVPANALLFSCTFLLVSAVLLYANPSIIAVFTVVTTMSAVLFIFVWTIILVSYIVFRKRRPALHAASKFKMPGGVYMCYVVLAFFAFLVWALTQKTDTLQALLVTPVWFIGLGIVWAVIRRRPEQVAHHELHRANVQTDRDARRAQVSVD